jgi:hypothetical protein
MRAFLSYDVAADILISGFEPGMHTYLRMVDFLSLCILFLLLFFSFIYIYIYFTYLFSRLIEDFELAYKEDIFSFLIIMIIHAINIK